MSYVDHGPRIFMAGRPNDGKPLIYGDYVLPRKRSEGRLKVYDSCSDIRAWSSNSLENFHYFRELTEHASTPGKIIPVSVVIDNLIGLGSQTQNELAACQRELQKYKSLKLTPKQEQELQDMDEFSIEIHQGMEQPRTTKKTKNLLETISVTANKSEPVAAVRSYSTFPARSDTCLSIGAHFKTDDGCDEDSYKLSISSIEQEENSYLHPTKINVPAYQMADCQSSSENLQPTTVPFESEAVSSRSDSTQNEPIDLNDVSKRAQTAMQKCSMYESALDNSQSIDTSLQVAADYTTNDSTTPLDSALVQSVTSKITITTSMATRPPSSTDLNSDDEFIYDQNRMQQNLQRGRTAKSKSDKIVDFESTSDSREISESEMETDSGARTTYGTESETDDEINKGVIIKKDSEIIVLKNELGAKELEVEELKEANKNFKAALKEKEDNIIVLKEKIKTLHGQLLEMGDHRNYEVQNLKKKICSSMCLIEKLKEDVAEKSEICCTQSQEIADLRFRAKDAELLRDERDSLAKEADSCNLALKQLKAYMKERDELEKRNAKLTLYLAEYEIEIKSLVDIIDNSFMKYDNRQVKMKGALEDLMTQIEERNSKLCQCEKQLNSMKQELKLKNSFYGMDEFEIASEDKCDCADIDQDASSKASLKTKQFNEYRNEHQSLFKQIEDPKNQVQDNYCCSYHASAGPESDSNSDLESSQESRVEHCDSANGPVNRQIWAQEQLLDTREEKCALQEELQESKKRISIRDAKEREDIITTVDNNEDIITSEERAINCLKNKIIDSDQYNEYGEQIESSQKRIDDTEENSKVKIREKLREASGDASYDEKIDQVLATYVRTYINKIHRITVGIEEAENVRVEILKKIAKQQREIDIRNEEITRLKNQITIYKKEERGEGDRRNEENSKRIRQLELQLSEITEKFELKDETIMKLKDSNESCNFRITGLNDELKTKSNKIVDLLEELNTLKQIKEAANEWKKKIEVLEPKLNSLNSENSCLKKEISELHVLLSEHNVHRLRLIKENEESEETIENNNVKYENQLQKYKLEIDKLENVKLSLDAKLNDAKEKIIKLNSTIATLRRSNEQSDQIAELQKEVLKLNEEKGKLEDQSCIFKLQLQNHENWNKRLEDDLNKMLEQNETLKYEITDLKPTNDRLSSGLEHEMSVKEQITTLPNKIYKDIKALKKQLDNSELQRGAFKNQIDQLLIKSTEDAITISELQRQIKLQDKQTSIQKEKILAMEKANRDLKIEIRYSSNELKNLTVRVKKIEKIRLESKSVSSEDKLSKKLPEHLELMKSKSDVSLEDMAEVMHRLNHLKNESIQRQTEIEKLTCDIKAKNIEIESLRENVKTLTKEKEDLQIKLKYATDKYNDTLMKVKQKYELCTKALHEKHNDSVKRLKAEYEETMKDTGSLFDSESWLKSLSLNEMAELYNRICTLMKLSEESKTYTLNDQQIEHRQQDLEKKSELKRKITLKNEIVQQQRDAHRKSCDLEPVIERQQRELQELTETSAVESQQNERFHLRNQSTLQHYSRNQIPRSCYTSNSDEINKDITCKQSDNHQDGFLHEQQNKHTKQLKSMFPSTMAETENVDSRKINFIHCCSIYHNCDNLQ